METSSDQSSIPVNGPNIPVRKTLRYRVHYRAVQTIVVIVFGAIIPTLLLALAAIGLTDLQKSLNPTEGEFATTLEVAQKTVSKASDPNSYVLAAFLFSEHSNRSVITTKNRLKIGVIQIGFAVMSVGIMFLLLGIRDGGLDAVSSPFR